MVDPCIFTHDWLEQSREREWVIVGEGGLAGNYPVGTKKHVGWETVRDSEVRSQGIETIRSGTLISTEERWSPDTGDTRIVNNRSKDL